MFENDETAILIEKKLLPVLEELARAEFGVYSLEGNIDAETESWMRESEKKIEDIAHAYLMGLLNLHLVFGADITAISRKVQ